jgi:uncharacterized protein HemY
MPMKLVTPSGIEPVVPQQTARTRSPAVALLVVVVAVVVVVLVVLITVSRACRLPCDLSGWWRHSRIFVRRQSLPRAYWS